MSAEEEKNVDVTASILENVLSESEKMPEDTPTVKGVDFNEAVDLQKLLESYLRSGFQATNLGLAIEEINKMLNWRLSDEPVDEDEKDEELKAPKVRKNIKCKIFLGYTSNMASSGIREVIRFLVQHKLVDVVVSTAGGIEEDLIKCLAPTFLGDFKLKGAALRKRGINRIGNLLVPNDNYCKFEGWINPILDKMLEEQENDGVVWTPSRMIDRLGKEINDENSIYHWCHRNGIPVFSPAITDGSIGDMLYFHSYNHDPPLTLDIVRDIRAMNDQAVRNAHHTGMILLGGGLIKHHICNANLMRNGADFAVFINTGQEFDGSDSGARPDEAISWGKIRADARPVKLYAEATLVFPLIVSQTFVPYLKKQQALDE